MPPRKPSPVGAHVFVSGGLATGALNYARDIGAEALQVFVSNPRGWAPSAGDADVDERFRLATQRHKMPVFVHAPYLVNLASPVAATREKSAASIRHAVARGRRIGARGIVVHAGAAVHPDHRRDALAVVREHLLPLLDQLTDDDPRILIEPAAGGGHPLVATVEDLRPYFAALEHHPRLGICLDTCHAFAAGHDLAAPGGIRRTLTALVKAVGRDRLELVHANDSRDGLGSARDRHANVGTGSIGLEPFAELFRHPATRGVPVVVETPGKLDAHAKDIALLKSLRDR